MSEMLNSQVETIILIGLTVLNIFFLSLNSAIVRFLFALFTLVIAGMAITFDGILFAPYLQMMAVVMSLICMFLAAKAKG